MLRKDVYGDTILPICMKLLKPMCATGLYTNELLEWYTEEEWNKMNEMIDHEKDEAV
jgi:hypothetical protein